MSGFSFAMVATVVSVWVVTANGQVKAEKPPNLAHLELATEIAATTDDGYPAILRITLKNVGNVAVDMPMPKLPCVPAGGGVDVRTQWHSNVPEDHIGAATGWGCSQDHFPSLMDRVHKEWIRLRPGEFIVLSESIRDAAREAKPGRIEYWAEYIPPEVKPEELVELQRAGYVVSTDKIETAHGTFVVH